MREKEETMQIIDYGDNWHDERKCLNKDCNAVVIITKNDLLAIDFHKKNGKSEALVGYRCFCGTLNETPDVPPGIKDFVWLRALGGPMKIG